MTDRTYLSFGSWTDVLTYVKVGDPLYYHAPLDSKPVRVRVRAAYKNGKLRLEDYWQGGEKHGGFSFTAGPDHLQRLRYPLRGYRG